MRNTEILKLKKLLPKNVELHWYGETDSTQTEARAAFLEHGPKERLHIANEQTAGRGRTGKTFYSPKDTGIYLTLTLSVPGRKTEDCLYLTTLSAVAVRRAVSAVCGIGTDIKWVNDLYLNGKKVAGILVEAMPESGWFLIGVGINLFTVSFPGELADKAGALLSQNRGFHPFRNRLLKKKQILASRIVNELKALSPGGMTPEIFSEYQEHSLLIGREITFEQDGGIATGKVLGLSDGCGLLVQVSGETRELTSGMILDFSAEKENL